MPLRRVKTPQKVGKALFTLVSVLALVFVGSSSTKLSYASEPVEYVKPQVETIVQTKEQVREYVLSEAKKAGVHVAKIDHIVENESHYDPNAIGDLEAPCTNKKSPLYGKGAYARGIWQITRCWYPEITDEQAHSVEWSTKWALGVIASSKKDCITQWTECRKWYK